MSQIVAGTYQIIKELGSGGGGVVYLATHLRLGKAVVLKADKRSLTKRPEVLRREVDALKNLSHPYIPQVYDFIEENGTVYTVIDYVEGESLDKPLKRGVRFSQPQVIQWACQLLEALQYLHTRPPYGILHGDIKPANIMLTPQGDIKLIDFNIALALGEEGAVRAGFSRGYASPEHYGIDYSGISRTQTVDDAATVVTESPETQVSSNRTGAPAGGSDSDGSRSKSSGQPVLLNVRSDIYSLGATLYHLLTGQRPPQDALQVMPIPAGTVSPAVAAIVQKAMEPDQEKRYQSAEEMLYDFRHLYERDSRTIRYKRTVRWAAALLCTVFLTGSALVFWGLRQSERRQNALVLAEYAMDACRRGDTEAALQYAIQALPQNNDPLAAPYTPQAQRALTQALGVYELADDFRSHMLLTLPSETLKLALSEDGGRLAALTQGQVHLYDTQTGALVAQLAALPSASGDIVFSAGRLFCAGEDGLLACSAETGQLLWQGEPATAIACSENGAAVAAVYKDSDSATVYAAADGTVLHQISFGGRRQSLPVNDLFADPQDDLLALSADGRWMAVSFTGGALSLIDLERGDQLVLLEASDYTHFEGGFCGDHFAYAASGSGVSAFAVVDTRTDTQTGGFNGTIPFHAYADSRGVFVTSGNTLVRIDPETGEQTEAAYTAADITAFSNDGCTAAAWGKYCTIFDAAASAAAEVSSDSDIDMVCLRGSCAALASHSTPYIRILKRETHSGAPLFTYDPAFAHDEARVSSDGSTVMLFRYDAFRLYKADGTLLCEQPVPEPERVYDQQYRRDASGDRLEVTWYDGTVRMYSAADGRCLSEAAGAPPDKSLLEEFETDTLRIVSPLHGTPEVYDRTTGKRLGALESQDYLTYVTQVGQYVVTEYMTAAGGRYGLLLNEAGGILADLPDLCDVLPDGTLVFDDQRGNLRQSRIYSLQELLAFANTYTKGGNQT